MNVGKVCSLNKTFQGLIIHLCMQHKNELGLLECPQHRTLDFCHIYAFRPLEAAYCTIRHFPINPKQTNLQERFIHNWYLTKLYWKVFYKENYLNLLWPFIKFGKSSHLDLFRDSRWQSKRPLVYKKNIGINILAIKHKTFEKTLNNFKVTMVHCKWRAGNS